MLSVLEEETDIFEVFPPHVDTADIPSQYESPNKKLPLKTFSEIDSMLQCGKVRDVKLILRENCWPTNSTIRSQLWPRLCHQHAPDKSMQEGFYWDLVNQLFGTTELPEKGILLPPFVESQHKHSYHLNKKGVKMADRIVCVLGFACPDITFSPMVYPITSLLLHFMTEEDCYNCLASIVASKDVVFITQTKLLHEVTWRTVMHISRKHVKSAAVSLGRYCPSSRAERIYVDWIWWVLQGLPFNHLVRVMDCYLHEGIKVFYRMSMALLVLFQKHTSSTNSVWYKEIQENGIDVAFNKFCTQIPASPKKLLRVAFGIRGLSSTYIRRVFVKTEMTLKSKAVLSESRQLLRSRSSENLPTSQSQINIQMMSHTLTIRELFTLWSWLPVRITMYQPVLLYTTEEHGCSLTTFYVRVEHHEPTLLMIKTCNNEVSLFRVCLHAWKNLNSRGIKFNLET